MSDSEAIIQVKFNRTGVDIKEPVLAVGAVYPYFNTDGRPNHPTDGKKRESIFSSTRWMTMWARAVDEINPNERGAFSLVGRPVWPQIKGYEFNQSVDLPPVFNKQPIELKSFYTSVPLNDNEIHPIVFGMSFLDVKLCILFYHRDMLLKERGAGKVMPLWSGNKRNDEIHLGQAVIPYPVNASYPENLTIDQYSVTIADVTLDIKTPENWVVGEAYSYVDGNVNRLPCTVFDWSGMNDLMTTTKNVFTLVGKGMMALADEGYLRKFKVTPVQLPLTNESQPQVQPSVEMGGELLKLSRFTVPSGIDDLIDAPKGYRWSVNVLGIVFLVNEKSGKLCAPHEVYDVRDKHGKCWLNDYQKQRLSELYHHQIDVLKGLTFTYKSFAQEIDSMMEE